MVRNVVTNAHRLARDELCTVDTVADHLQLHPKTVLRYIRDGRLPARKIGKAYRIRRADLDAFAGTPVAADTVADAARVTSIVDVPGVGSGLAGKLAGAVTNALHGSENQRRDVHAEVVYEAENGHLKIIVIGTVTDTRSLLGLVQVWLEQLTT
jgi:excisionase family DNA binding protein